MRTKNKKNAKSTKNKRKKTVRKRKSRRNPIQTFVASALVVIAVGYIATAAYLYMNQRKFLYFPQPGVLATGEQQIEIRNGDITLRGWVVNPGNSNAIIYFGGNGERPEASIVDFKDLFSNHTIYFINYRGYGESDGSPTETGLYDDAMAIYDHISPDHNHIIVIGRSLGTGVATYLATERDIHRLVLVEPYDCLVNIAQATYPIFPMRLMMKDRYNSAERASRITAPTLIIKAENDQIIPGTSTDNLIARFNRDILETATIPEATHNNIQNYTQYYMLLRDFIATE
ncbi:MAG: alpha/beta hydrolase [Candidatus Fermentibacteria bacterium]|nr:alpha/beta hydrolase [Candidatus Fermentibacteria bacterium]